MRETSKPVDFVVPPLGSLLSYKIVYLLCTLNPKTNMLKATHFTICVYGGPYPSWGVWSINNIFQRFFPLKAAVADAYPNHVWRRLYGTWTMVNAKDMTNVEKDAEMSEVYHEGKRSGNVVAFASKRRA